MTGFVIALTILVLLGFWLILREVREAHKRIDQLEGCLWDLAKRVDGAPEGIKQVLRKEPKE